MSQASQQDLNKFVRVVDEFMANYAKLIKPETKAQVYATGNQILIDDYAIAVGRGRILKRSIETTVGAWNAAKREYRKITDVSSTVIGDAIDEIRSWFGYRPAGSLECYRPMSGLGAIQIPAAVWVSSIVAAALLLNSAMRKIFIAIEASKIQRENPGTPRDVALEQASKAVASGGFFGLGIDWKTVGIGALAAWFIFGR